MYGLSFIRLNRKRLKKVAIAAAGLLAVLALTAISLCGYLGIHSRMDLLGFQIMVQEHYPPIWKDLAWRRIRKGDPLDSLLQRYPPVRRENFGPYTFLHYIPWPDYDGLWITAKDGKLIRAWAGSSEWLHTFFDTPEEEEASNRAYSAYMRQQMLEAQAFQIHRAITGGQDVFFARLIERREIPDNSQYSQEMMKELAEIYGKQYVDYAMTKPELTVEVTKVVCGSLQVGAVLTFLCDDCGDVWPGEPEPVFLHLDDVRLIYPTNPPREIYLTVPKAALDWYQSLTADQVKDFEARRLAEWAKREELQAIKQ